VSIAARMSTTKTETRREEGEGRERRVEGAFEDGYEKVVIA
jgi:hypothetical protein